MNPPERHQGDGLQDEYSAIASIDFTDTDVIVRPEFEAETKIETILRNHGIDPMNQRQAQWGAEIDERIDLQTGIHAVRSAQAIYDHVPQEIRGEFPNWQSVLNGIENGSYQYALQEHERRQEEKKKRKEQRAADREELDGYRKGKHLNRPAPENPPAAASSSDNE